MIMIHQWFVFGMDVVLPPSNALLYNMEMTYGEVRKSLIDAGATEERVALGCSSQDMQAVVDTSRRHLSGPSIILNCTANELFCWYRCQPLNDDLKTCAQRNIQLWSVLTLRVKYPIPLSIMGRFLLATTHQTLWSQMITITIMVIVM